MPWTSPDLYPTKLFSTHKEREREREMNRKAGDWNCRCCQHLNFGRRDACQRCGDPRIGAGVCTGGEVRPAGTVEVKPGDWYCTCGVHNFASRQSCFKCGSSKCEDGDLTNAGYFEALSSLHAVLPPGWKSGDWICTRMGCNEHNFASRSECYRCNWPREYQGGYIG